METETQELIEIDGFLVAPDGEIIDHVERGPAFHVMDRGSAEWVLEKLQIADAAKLALETRLLAIHENLGRLILEQERRREWLERRFGDELAAFAQTQLRGRARTWTTPYGSVAFRKTVARVEITDMAAAVAWAKREGLLWHVAETVKVAELKEAVLRDPPEAGFAITPGGESVKFNTGVWK